MEKLGGGGVELGQADVIHHISSVVKVIFFLFLFFKGGEEEESLLSCPQSQGPQVSDSGGEGGALRRTGLKVDKI